MKQYRDLMLSLILFSLVSPVESKLIEKDPDGSTRVNAPFVHVNVDRSDPRGSHVQVRAPFTHLDNPVRGNDARVSAPFTKVGQDPATGRTRVNAPFTKVRQDPETGRTVVSAPFTKVDNPPGKGNLKVKAPFTRVSPALKETNSTTGQ